MVDKIKSYHQGAYYIALLLISILLFSLYSKDINLITVVRGFSPHDYVNQKINPENFKKNFMGTALADQYDKSLVMRSFYLAKKWINLDPNVFVYPFMGVQTLLFIFSLAYLITKLFDDRFFTLISVTIIILVPLAGTNLSNFGNGYAGYLRSPLYYGFAISFSFFAIGFSVSKRHLPMFLFLMLTSLCHITIGFFSCVFLGSYFVFYPNSVRNREFLIGLSVFIVIIGSYILSVILSSSISGGGVSVEDWVKSTRMFSFHWYPITMKRFTTNAHKELLPILFTLISFILSSGKVSNKETKNRVTLGILSCVFLSIIGVFCVEILQIPAVIKISPQRSTGLVSFIGVLFYCYYLYINIRESNFVIAVVSVVVFVTFLASSSGIALLPLLVFVIYETKYSRFLSLQSGLRQKIVIISFVTISVVLIFIVNYINVISKNTFTHQLSILSFFNVNSEYDLLLKGGYNPIFEDVRFIISMIVLSFMYVFVYRLASLRVKQLFLILSLSGLIFIIPFREYKINSQAKQKFSSDRGFQSVQKWARSSTKNDALFMLDPSHRCNWRDLSNRSYTGCYREWGQTSILYDTDKERYIDGKTRMKEFGVDIDNISIKEINNSNIFPYSTRFRNNIKKNYYSLDTRQIVRLANKYDIDYIVMDKRYLDNARYRPFRLLNTPLTLKNVRFEKGKGENEKYDPDFWSFFISGKEVEIDRFEEAGLLIRKRGIGGLILYQDVFLGKDDNADYVVFDVDIKASHPEKSYAYLAFYNNDEQKIKNATVRIQNINWQTYHIELPIPENTEFIRVVPGFIKNSDGKESEIYLKNIHFKVFSIDFMPINLPVAYDNDQYIVYSLNNSEYSFKPGN